MDGIAFSSAASAVSAASLAGNSVRFPSGIRVSRRSKDFLGKQKKFLVSASKKEEPQLNEWDQMELKFGRLLGEDPKLTLAKLVARKVNPDVSFLEVEKSFYKNKGKLPKVEDVPLDWSKEKKPASSLSGLNLVRPVPKKGVKFETNENPIRPEMKKPSSVPKKPSVAAAPKGRVPNVILRKPSSFYDDDDGESKLRLKPNISLQMRNDNLREGFSDMTLLRRPNPVSSNDEEEKKEIKEESTIEMQHHSKDLSGSSEEKTLSNSVIKAVPEASLQGRPQRLEAVDSSLADQEVLMNHEEHRDSIDLKGPTSRSASEESDWNKAGDLLKAEARADVELISSSTRGFVVSFGSLIGFLPYRNLAAKWKFLAFESWLRRKGIDPSKYRPNLGVIESRDVMSKTLSPDSSVDSRVDKKTSDGEISSDSKLEDLLMIYDREKQKFLSCFVGQKIKVTIVMANRNSRKLIFSMRPRENEEEVEKKRNLMAKLRVGDVVKCCIKKITYFGIFCEIEGVPALIHQTEVSWDATLDPSSYFKIGQVVEAKVHQLDFALERIFLSLKEITPDPLTEALESVAGNNDLLDGSLQGAELDTEWSDVESLIKELESTDGIQTVSKGRFFLSPGLAPTFQVYMASMFENEYKLLARSENKVQELIVESWLSNEEMKSTIMSCTNRVQ